jgi:glycosyltransferase involved in cell wall biosynthesis
MCMKVFQVVPYYFPLHPGGLEKIAQTISVWLQDISWYDLHDIVSDISKYDREKREDIQNVTYLPSFDLVSWFPVPKFRKIAFRKKMHHIIQQKPDCILTHTRFFLQSMMWGLVAKLSWAKRIHIEHGAWFVTWYAWYIRFCAWLFDRTIGLWIFRQCDVIVTISDAHKQFIARFTKKNPVVIYNPVDFSPKPKEDNNIPQIWFIGRLVPLKWVDLLVDALYTLQDMDWECTIVWAWSERQHLESKTIQLWLQDRITFVGADDRDNRLHRFDVFVNPSFQEWVPTTVVEALLAKCVVVATDVGGTREITHEDDLILIHPWVREMLELWLRKAIETYSLSAWSSFETVKKNFGVKNNIKRYDFLLRNTVENFS